MSNMVAGLTEAQETFCLEYAKSGNASAAYRVAYPKSQKWTENALNVQACKSLKIPKICLRIEQLRAAAEQKTDMTIERWAQEVTRLAVSDPRNIMHPDGRIKMPHELDAETAAAVASFKFDVDGTIEYKFWPKTQALDMMAKHKGAYEKDNAQKGGLFDALPREVVKQIAERLKRMHGEKTIEGEVIKG